MKKMRKNYILTLERTSVRIIGLVWTMKERTAYQARRCEWELKFHRINLITEKVFGVTYLLKNQYSVCDIINHSSRTKMCGAVDIASSTSTSSSNPDIIRSFRCTSHYRIRSFGQDFRVYGDQAMRYRVVADVVFLLSPFYLFSDSAANWPSGEIY